MSLFVRKDVRSLLAEAGAGTLRRELGPLNLVTLGIGAVIGAGIFVLAGNAASQNAGPAITLSMVLAGVAVVRIGGMAFRPADDAIDGEGNSIGPSTIDVGDPRDGAGHGLTVAQGGVRDGECPGSDGR